MTSRLAALTSSAPWLAVPPSSWSFPSQSLCSQQQEVTGICPSPGRAEKGRWGHQLFPFYLGTPGNGKRICPGLCTGMYGSRVVVSHVTHGPIGIMESKKMHPPILSSPSPNNYGLPIALHLGWEFLLTLHAPVHLGTWSGLDLCKSCVFCHKSCEFMCVTVPLCPEDTVSV